MNWFKALEPQPVYKAGTWFKVNDDEFRDLAAKPYSTFYKHAFVSAENDIYLSDRGTSRFIIIDICHGKPSYSQWGDSLYLQAIFNCYTEITDIDTINKLNCIVTKAKDENRILQEKKNAANRALIDLALKNTER